MRIRKINTSYLVRNSPLHLVIGLSKNAVHDPFEAVALVNGLAIAIDDVDLRRRRR